MDEVGPCLASDYNTEALAFCFYPSTSSCSCALRVSLIVVIVVRLSLDGGDALLDYLRVHAETKNVYLMQLRNIPMDN